MFQIIILIFLNIIDTYAILIYIYSLSTVKIAELMSLKYLQVSDAYEKLEKSMRSISYVSKVMN